eukprot:5623874-Alexandrium_andersonii.AAC.1
MASRLLDHLPQRSVRVAQTKRARQNPSRLGAWPERPMEACRWNCIPLPFLAVPRQSRGPL